MKVNKCIFLYNPSSGKGKIKKNLEIIKKTLTEKFGLLDVVESKSPEHLKEVVSEGCKTYDYFFFSGGDGTFNMVLNAIPDIPNLPIFGYLPGGSTCDMSYNLNINKVPKKGVVDLVNSKPKEYNVGQFGNEKFIYVADFGAFTNVSHITPQDKKRKFGVFAYIYYGIKSVFTTVKAHRVIVDGVVYYTPLMIISNSREVASFKINPEKVQDDGNYYIVITKNGFMHGIFNVIHLFGFGLESAIRHKKVISFTANNFTIDCDCEDWDVDGEYVKIKFPSFCGYSRKKIVVLTNRE